MSDKYKTNLKGQQVVESVKSSLLTVPTIAARDALNTNLFTVGKVVEVADDGSGVKRKYEWNGVSYDDYLQDDIRLSSSGAIKNNAGDEILTDSTLSIDKTDLTTGQSNPSYKEGRLFYDNVKKAVSYYNDEADVIVNLGQELLFIVMNQSGSLIPNGSVIAPSSTSVITLADACVKDKSRVIAVTTQDIADGATGYATKLGQVGGLDTSSFTVGDILYLSDSTPGTFTNTEPSDGGSYVITVGVVDVVDPTDGIITVDTRSTDLTIEVTDTNGFPRSVRSNLNLEFVDETRTFSINPISGTKYHLYQNGIKYEKTGTDSIVITDVEGLHAIYYDDGVLFDLANPTSNDTQSLILDKCLVAYVYWDATNQEANYFGSELHGISMSPETHLYHHFTRGAKYLEGYAIGDMVVDDDGDSNSHAQFSITMGLMTDEDNFIMSPSIGSTVGIPVYYLSGINPDLRRTFNPGYPVLTTGTGRLAWNEKSGSTWQLSEIANNDFVLYHIFGVNGVTDYDSVISIMGQNDYPTLSQARTGAETEVSTILRLIPIEEMIPIATVIYQSSNGYANVVKSRVRSTAEGDDYIDWRTTSLSAGVAASDHGNLAGLETTSGSGGYKHITDAEPLYLPEFTTSERNGFSAVARMIIFNSTTNTFQGYNGTSWVDLG